MQKLNRKKGASHKYKILTKKERKNHEKRNYRFNPHPCRARKPFLVDTVLQRVKKGGCYEKNSFHLFVFNALRGASCFVRPVKKARGFRYGLWK
jgi:hypothetical protein